MFDQVVVWLDPLAPVDGAFAHAVEWANRLHLPLHGVTFAGQELPGSVLEACAEACARRGVAWTQSACDEQMTPAFQDSFSPGRLSVFGRSFPSNLRRNLMRWLFDCPPLATLVCPDRWVPLKRVLLLHQTRDPANRFLTTAVQLCHAFQVTPVVLTVARSEHEAQLRQQFAEETLAAHDPPAKFDFIVGNDLRAAVTLDARWRNCTQVWAEQQKIATWRRWLRADPLQPLSSLSDSLAVVAFSQNAGVLAPGRAYTAGSKVPCMSQ